MATLTTTKYQGRYVQLDVSQSGAYLNWTLSVIGGTSNYYNVYNLQVEINGGVVYKANTKTNSDGTFYHPYTSKTFPAATGSTSGSVYIGQGTSSKNVTCVLQGNVFSNSAPRYSTTVTMSGISLPTFSTSVSPGRTSATMYGSISNNPSSYWRLHLYNTSKGWQTSTEGSQTSFTQSGLSPNTSYNFYYLITDINDGNYQTQTAVSFKTTCNAPSSLSISRASSSTSSITVNVSATGDTNAAITNYTLYYKAASAGSYSSVSLGTSTSKTISSLNADTDYNFYFTATNAGGTTTSGVVTYSTLLNTPSLSTSVAFVEEEDGDDTFSATVTATASVSPSRTLTYTYSNSFNNVSATTTASSYTFTGLPEEETIIFTTTVVADATSTNAQDTSTVYTLTKSVPEASSKIAAWIKKDGVWTQGKIYAKKRTKWYKAELGYGKIEET